MSTSSYVSYLSDRLCIALKSRRVVDFFKEVVVDSYCDFFPDLTDEVKLMMVDSIDLLVQSQTSKVDHAALVAAINYIRSELFFGGDKIGFLKRYHEYKISKRPIKDYKAIRQYIIGRKVLDIGAGNCYFSIELKKHGYDVSACDVLDYHEKNLSLIPFYKMSSPTDLSFVKAKQDTVFLKTVLHHISEENITILLNKLRSKTERLVIEEDVYGINNSNNYCSITEDRHSKIYCGLTQEEQVQYLTLMDFFGNVVVYGIFKMNMPYNFKTISQWQSLLSDCSWNLKQTVVLGFDKTRIHRPFQAWFICD